MSVRILEDDHVEATSHLERICEATDEYAVLEGACTSYRNVHLHLHKENTVSFSDAENRLECVVTVEKRRYRPFARARTASRNPNALSPPGPTHGHGF